MLGNVLSSLWIALFVTAACAYRMVEENVISNISLDDLHHAAESMYSEAEARQFLDYTRASTCSQSALESWTCGEMCDASMVVPGSVRFLTSEQQRAQGYVAQIPGDAGQETRCVGAFRGSVRAENWVANARFGRKMWNTVISNSTMACEGCRVHKGFALVFDALRDQLIQAVHELGCRSIRFSGHSLGAAIATLATYEARGIQDLRVETPYTYGSPTVGNKAFVKAFSAAAEKDNVKPPMWRIVHYHDQIPVINPKGKHIPTEVLYKRGMRGGDYQICRDSPGIADPACTWNWKYYPWQMANSDHLWYFQKPTAHNDLPSECEVHLGSLIDLSEDVNLVASNM